MLERACDRRSDRDDPSTRRPGPVEGLGRFRSDLESFRGDPVFLDLFDPDRSKYDLKYYVAMGKEVS